MSKARILSSTGLTLLSAMMAIGTMGPASASDWLRGSFSGQHQVDWSGFYGGAHAGITSGQTDPRDMAQPLVENALPNSVLTDPVRNMINFKSTNKQGASYGGFVGMNWQWDDVVLGWEADYSHSNISANSNSSQARAIRPTGTTDEYAVTANATSRAKISDWATLRARIGYSMGIFMPYLTAGVAMGNVDGRATVSGSWQRYDVSTGVPVAYPSPFFSGSFNGVVGRRGVSYGGAVGAGVDMQFLPNTFLRTEWQYIQLASGGQRPAISINTARVAGGVKF